MKLTKDEPKCVTCGENGDLIYSSIGFLCDENSENACYDEYIDKIEKVVERLKKRIGELKLEPTDYLITIRELQKILGENEAWNNTSS